jgi:hypothetical protein
MLHQQFFTKIFVLVLLLCLVFFNFSSIHFAKLLPAVKTVKASTFSMQTGYYIGTGATLSITGLGFRPDLVMIKPTTNVGAGMVMKSSAMPANTSQYFTATANDTNTMITLDDDGFTLSSAANVNTLNSNTQWMWVAFGGSDCINADSTFCVGAYTGNGTTTSGATGFQPNLVVIKASTNKTAMWKNSAMPAGDSAYFINTNNGTNGTFITTFNATGFSVGNSADINSLNVINYFFAFKEVDGYLDVGSYTGNATDNRDITSADNANTAGLTFQPDFVWVKNSNGAGVYNAISNMTESNGDFSQYFANITSDINYIQSLLPAGGFQVGSIAVTNGNTNTMYYVAFAGTPNPTSSGTYKMAEGTYIGAVGQTVAGLGFKPDVILIKKDGANVTFFKTSLMPTSYTSFINASSDFTTGVTIDSDGFSLGASANTNTVGALYYYQAFGNAWSPHTNRGAADFAIGVYNGNNADNRTILRFPWQPQLLMIKATAGVAAVWRTSLLSGDLTDFFLANAAAANYIQAINSDGLQAGTALDSYLSLHYWFAFRTSSNLAISSYTGNGQARSITEPGFKPDLMWAKKRTGGTAREGILRPASLTGNNTHSFIATANFSGGITSFDPTGFSLGTSLLANENTFTYDYVAWKIPLEYSQSAYRFFANTDTTDVGSALAGQNTGATLGSAGDAFRLRILIKSGLNKMPASYESFKLQFVDSGSGTCAAPSGGTPASYTDVTADTVIAFKDNAPNDGDALTANANDPTLGTEINQGYKEANNFTNVQAAIPAEQYGKWDFALYDHGAPIGTTYCLRVVKSDGTALSSYVYPTITTATPVVASISISPGGSVGLGELAVSGVTDTTASPQTITVDGGPVDLDIKTTSFTDGSDTWAFGNSAAANQVKWEYQNGVGGWNTFLAADPSIYVFDTNVAQGQTRDLSLQITMPSSTVSYLQHSADVTVIASAP